MNSALVVIDMQNDFLPGGALAVAGGDQIIDNIIKEILSGKYETVVFTKDWHPAGHKSFASSHPGKNPFDVIQLHNHDQVLWPDHCVQGTLGAELHEKFTSRSAGLSALDRAAYTVCKGMNQEVDSYSAFYENWGAPPEGRGVSWTRAATGLEGALLQRGVRAVSLVGLARDYCVKWSGEDIGRVLPTEVIWNLTRSVNPANDQQTESELRKADVKINKTEYLF